MTKQNKRRLKPRFSLRTFLALALLLSIVVAFYAKRVVDARQQRRACLKLFSAGAHISYGVDENSWIQGSYWGTRPSRADNIQSILLGGDFFNNVTRVTFSDSRILDGKFERFKEPEKFVVDDDLRHLASLPYLKSLSLYQTDITDDGLDHLKSLSKLKYLILEGTKVTDAGVEKLQSQIPNCEIWR